MSMSMQDYGPGSDPPPPAARTRSLILYLYGGFGRRLGGWVAVAHLIQLMESVGVESPAVRTAVSRMKQDGLLTAEVRAGTAGYALTPTGWRILDEGDERILRRREPASLQDGWVITVFSIPEARRDLRHQVRRRLSWMGFGTIAPGVWIAPVGLRAEAEAMMAELGAGQFFECLEARQDGLESSRRLVARAWDLEAIGRGYEKAVAVLEPVMLRYASSSIGPRRVIADYLTAIAVWRTLPYLDPGLPAEVLPPSWLGDKARWLYFGLLDTLDAPAFELVRTVVGARDPSYNLVTADLLV